MAFVLIYYLLYCYTVGKFYVFWNYWPDLLIIYLKLQIKNVSFLGVHLLSVRISTAFSCILLLLCIFSQTSKIRSGSGELRSKD